MLACSPGRGEGAGRIGRAGAGQPGAGFVAGTWAPGACGRRDKVSTCSVARENGGRRNRAGRKSREDAALENLRDSLRRGKEVDAVHWLQSIRSPDRLGEVVSSFVRKGWRAGAEMAFLRASAQGGVSVQMVEKMMELYRGDVHELMRLLARNRSGEQSTSQDVYLTALEGVRGCSRAAVVMDEMDVIFASRSRKALVLLLNKCAAEGNMQGAVQVLEELSQHGYRVDGEVYALLLRIANKNGHTGEAGVRSSLRMIKKAGLFDLKVLAQAAEAHVERGEADMVAFIARLGNKPSTRLYAVLIGMFGEQGDVKSAERAMKDLIGAGVEPSTEVYNALIRVYIKDRNLDMVKEVYSRLRGNQRAVPNAKTFHLIIEAFRAEQDVAGCEAAVASMKSYGIMPLSGIYNTLLKAYAESSDLEGFELCLKRMLRSRVSPNVSTFGILVDSYSKLGWPHKGEAWFARMGKYSVRPDTIVCTSLMQLRIEDGRLSDAAEVLLKIMPEHNVRADRVTYKLLIGALLNRGRMEHAEVVARAARDNGYIISLPEWNRTVD